MFPFKFACKKGTLSVSYWKGEEVFAGAGCHYGKYGLMLFADYDGYMFHKEFWTPATKRKLEKKRQERELNEAKG